MKTKSMRLIGVLAICLAAIVTLVSCGGLSPVKFEVSFVVDGVVYDTVSTSGAETIKLPDDPVKPGHVFRGWYWDEGTWEQPFTANSLLDAPLTNNMRVYARFTPEGGGGVTPDPNPTPNPNPTPDGAKTISDIKAGTVGESYTVTAWVVGINSQSFLIEDATGRMLVYMGAGFEYRQLGFGDKVTVSGTTSVYGGAVQFAKGATFTKEEKAAGDYTPAIPTAKKPTAAELDAYATATNIEPEYIEVTGTLTISGSYYNLAIEGATITGSVSYIISELEGYLAEYNGKAVTVYGYVTGAVSGGKYLNLMVLDFDTPATPGPGVDPDPEPEVIEGTIAEIKAGEVGKTYKTTAIVYAFNERSFLIGDATGMMLVYRGASWTRDVAIGDSVTVTGKSSIHAKAVQFGDAATYVNNGTTVYDAEEPLGITPAQLDAYLTAEVAELRSVAIIGKVQVNGDHTNVIVADASAVISLTYLTSDNRDAIRALDGCSIVAYGYITGQSGESFVNVMLFGYDPITTPDPDPDPEPEPEVIEGTIAEIKAGEVGKTYKTTAKLVAVNAQSFLLADDTGMILVYCGAGLDYTSFGFGDEICVTGTTSVYGGAVQFAKGSTFEVVKKGEGTPSMPTPKEPTAAELDAYATAAVIDPEFIKVTGILTIDGNYYNLALDGATIIGSISYVIPEMVEYLAQYNGKELSVMGYVTGVVSGGKYLNIMALGFSGGATPDPDPTPDPEPEVIEGTIAEIKAGEVGKTYKTTALVYAVNAQGFILADESGAILVYTGSGWTQDVHIGDEVTITGTTSVYANAVQFGKGAEYEVGEFVNFDLPIAEKITAEQLDAYLAMTGIEPTYVEIYGKADYNAERGWCNVLVDGATARVALSYFFDYMTPDFIGHNGKSVVVKGYITGALSSGVVNMTVFDITYIEETTVADILAGDADTEYVIKGTVYCFNAQSFVIGDGTGYILVYMGADWTVDVEIGDIVTVTGITSIYGNAIQFRKGSTYEKQASESVEYPDTVDKTAEELDAYSELGRVIPEYATVVGTLEFDGTYYNLTVDGASVSVSLTYITEAGAKVLEPFIGKTIRVGGYITGITASKYIQLMVYGFDEIETEDPTPDPEPDEPEVIEGTIAEIKAGEIGKTYKLTANIIAVNAQSFLLSDETGMILVYTGAGLDYNAFSYGDLVTVTGVTSVYGGAIQFGKGAVWEIAGYDEDFDDTTMPETKKLTAEELDAYATATDIEPLFAEITGILTIDGSYYNLAIEGATIIGSISYVVPELAEMLAEYNGKSLTVMGYITGTASNGKFLSIMALGFSGGATPEPDTKPTIEAIKNSEIGLEYTVCGTVMGYNAQSFLIADESGMMLVYMGSAWTPDVEVGKSYVVTGVTATYGNAVQFTQGAVYELGGEPIAFAPTARRLTLDEINAYATMTVVEPLFVEITGTLAISGNYYNVTIDGATVIGSISYPTAEMQEELAKLNGTAITFRGYVTGVTGSGRYLNVLTVELEGSSEGDDPDVVTPVEMTIEEALAAEIGTLVTIRGTVESMYREWDDNYGNCSPYITDGTNRIIVFRTTTNVSIGDKLVVTGIIGAYDGVNQIAQGSTVVIETSDTPDTPDPDEPEIIEGTIAEIKAGETGKTYMTTARVAMFNAQSFLIYDDTGMMLVYTGEGLDYMSLMPNTKVTVTGTTSVYGGAIQFGKGATYEILEAGNGQPTIPTAKEPTPAELDAYATAAVIEPEFIKVTGFLTIDGNYYNLAFDGAGITGSISYVVPELAEMLAEYNGKSLTVMGFVTGAVSGGKYLNIMALGFQGGSSGGESGGTEGGGSGEGSDDGKIHVRFYHTMGSALKAVLDEYIARFNEMYPNIVIEHDQIGAYDDVRDTVKNELSVGDGPDIAYCYPDHVALYNKMGKVSALDDLIASQLSDGNGGIIGMTEAEREAFIDSFLTEGNQYGDGLTYSLPFLKSTEVMFYNKTFFDQHGLTVPKTWDEMEETLARIKEIDPYSVPLGYDSESNFFITLCEQLGGLYVDEDNNFIFDNDTVKDMIARLHTWYKNGWLTTQEIYGAYTSSLFTQTGEGVGKCYMSIASSAGASHNLPEMDGNGEYLFEVGIAPVPQIDISNPKAVMQGPSLCIFNHGDEERLTAAWLFVKFLTTCPELQADFSVASAYMPVTEATLENEAYVEYLESANGYENITALAIKAGFEQSDAYYSASAFVGSADAREIVGLLLRDCIIYDGEDVGAYIDEAFKKAVESCEMYR